MKTQERLSVSLTSLHPIKKSHLISLRNIKFIYSLLLTALTSVAGFAQAAAPPEYCVEHKGMIIGCIYQEVNYVPGFCDNLMGGDDVYGTGCKLFWHMDKCAVRGGKLVNAPSWDEDSIGVASASFGQDTKALDQFSFSAGRFAHALEDYTVAMGYDVNAEGHSSLSLGHSSHAIGQQSIAVGHQVSTTGALSNALGSHSISANSRTTTIGKYLTANGQNNMIIGSGFDSSNHLENTNSRSLMIGFGSTVPTLFIKQASNFNQVGKVGIGLTNPDQKLDVAGAIRIDTSSIGVDGSMRFTGTSFQGHTNGSWVTLAGDGGTSVFSLNNTDAYYSAGHVGIGSANPSSTLEVNGDVTIVGSVVGPSDQRLKKNIADLQDAMSVIESLQAQTYRYRQDTDLNTPQRVQYGFVAQDVTKVKPTFIDKQAIKTNDGHSYMGMSHEQLIAILIEALQELVAENQNLNEQFDHQLEWIEKQIE